MTYFIYSNYANLCLCLFVFRASSAPEVISYQFTSVTCLLTPSILYVSLDVTLGVMVPFIILFASYSVIFCIVRSQMRRIAPPLSTTTGCVVGDDTRGGSTLVTSVSAPRSTRDSEVSSFYYNII